MKTTLRKIYDALEARGEVATIRDLNDGLLPYLGKNVPDDEPLEILTILDAIGFVDTVHLLFAVDGCERELRLFAADCAERALPIFEARRSGDDKPRKAIQVARDYANGKASADELEAAGNEASDYIYAEGGGTGEESSRAMSMCCVEDARKAAKLTWHLACGSIRRAGGVEKDELAWQESRLRHYCKSRKKA